MRLFSSAAPKNASSVEMTLSMSHSGMPVSFDSASPPMPKMRASVAVYATSRETLPLKTSAATAEYTSGIGLRPDKTSDTCASNDT